MYLCICKHLRSYRVSKINNLANWNSYFPHLLSLIQADGATLAPIWCNSTGSSHPIRSSSKVPKHESSSPHPNRKTQTWPHVASTPAVAPNTPSVFTARGPASPRQQHVVAIRRVLGSHRTRSHAPFMHIHIPNPRFYNKAEPQPRSASSYHFASLHISDLYLFHRIIL